MLHTFPVERGLCAMIFEALFIALPFALGLGVRDRTWRVFAAWVVLEVFLLWLGFVAFSQPLLALGAFTLLFSTTAFAVGWRLSMWRPRLRAVFSPGLAFLAGVVLTGTLAGELGSTLRKETVKTARWVNARADATWTALNAESAQLGATRATVSEPASHLRFDLVDQQAHPLFQLVGFEYWLTAQPEKTFVLTQTRFESRLVPTWLWRPVERRMVEAEHHDQLAQFPGGFLPLEADGVEVLLTVQTSPPTRVTIIPPLASARPRVVLGQTPIRQLGGARVGDTVLLESEEHGVHYQELIEFGQPGELKLISKTFREK